MLCLDLFFRVKTDHLSPCQKKNKFHIGHDLTDCFFSLSTFQFFVYKDTSWHSKQITGIYLSNNVALGFFVAAASMQKMQNFIAASRGKFN